MPTSATGAERAAAAGFTLLELMVVLVILGLASAAVVLAIPGPARGLRTEAERFAARIAAARDLALTEGRPVAVAVSPAGYRFERRAAGRWLPLDPPLDARPWPAGTTAAITGGEGGRSLLDPTGAADPLGVRLDAEGASVQVDLGADGVPHVAR